MIKVIMLCNLRKLKISIRLKRAFKIFGINFALLIIFFSLLAVIPPFFKDLKYVFKYAFSHEKLDERVLLPNYTDYPWARKHFVEFNSLSTTYYDFIGWRRNKFEGETINIDNFGYRRHSLSNNSSASKIWLFGGSTIWGTGAKDSLTIPAYLERISNLPTFNYGESGYTAHQSLNLLMKAYLEGGKPDYIFFYDGVNDVSHKCRSELNFFSSEREAQIREKVLTGKDKPIYLWQVISPAIKILASFIHTNKLLKTKAFFDCDTNTEKASMIAEALIMDWTLAKNLAESRGAKFVPILQPVAYIGNPNLKQLDRVVKNKELEAQYISVYKEIKKQLKTKNITYLDYTKLFDGDTYIYIDFCHVSPNGNEIIAKNLSSYLAR